MSASRHGEVPESERLRPGADDGCPLFSARLEDHLVAVSRGEEPARGRFCGHCYTPIARDTAVCPHCATGAAARPPVERVPEPVLDILRQQRRVEKAWVNGLAYVGLAIAIVGGITVVLAIPFFRESLIWATVLYGAILLFGGRTLAGVLGGVYGDRIGYERARRGTVAAWEAFARERDAGDGTVTPAP